MSPVGDFPPATMRECALLADGERDALRATRESGVEVRTALA